MEEMEGRRNEGVPLEAVSLLSDVCPADTVVTLGLVCREWGDVCGRHRLDFRGSRWDTVGSRRRRTTTTWGRGGNAGRSEDCEQAEFKGLIGWARGELRDLVLPGALAWRLGAEVIVEAVEANVQLRTLSIEGGPSTKGSPMRRGLELTWSQLVRVVRACPGMRRLDVGLDVSLSADEGAEGQGQAADRAGRAIGMLVSPPALAGPFDEALVRLRSLNLRGVALDTDLTLRLIDGVLGSDSLVQLDVRGCGLGVYSGACLMQAWASFSVGGRGMNRDRSMADLWITDDRVALHTMRVLADDPSLVDLQMDGERQASAGGGMGALAASFAQNTVVRSISLTGNELDDHIATELSEGLLSNGSVEVLDLEQNSIGNAGAISLARLLAPGVSSIVGNGQEGLPPLRRLGLAHNLVQDAGVLHLARSLLQNETLRDLDLRGNGFSAGGARFLATLLVRNSTLAALSVAENEIADEGGIVLSRALASNRCLRHIDMSSCGIGDRTVLELSQALRWAGPASVLTSFSARGNSISGLGTRELSRALMACPNLRALDLSDNNLEGHGVESLVMAALSAGCTLEVLTLAGNEVGDNGMERISKWASALGTRASLRHLDLGYNGLGPSGVRCLGEILKSGLLFNLSSLCLGGNAFGPEGAQVLCGAIMGSPCANLAELTVDGCALEDQGCAFLARSLAGSPIQRLHVGNNRIGDVGLIALCESLLEGGQGRLQVLRLCDNLVTHSGALHLAEALKRNSREGSNSCLHTLDCSQNRVGDVGAAAIADAILLNCGLVELLLASNDVGNMGAQGLARALASAEVKLALLDLSENRISEVGAKVLAAALCGNTSLTRLDFSDNCLFDWGAREMSKLLLANTAITTLSLDGNGIGRHEAAAIRVAWTGSPTRRGLSL